MAMRKMSSPARSEDRQASEELCLFGFFFFFFSSNLCVSGMVSKVPPTLGEGLLPSANPSWKCSHSPLQHPLGLLVDPIELTMNQTDSED